MENGHPLLAYVTLDNFYWKNSFSSSGTVENDCKQANGSSEEEKKLFFGFWLPFSFSFVTTAHIVLSIYIYVTATHTSMDIRIAVNALKISRATKINFPSSHALYSISHFSSFHSTAIYNTVY